MSVASSVIDRRLHPREAVREAVRLVTPTGRAYDAVVVDRSLRGLRIEIDAATILPAEMSVLSQSAGAVHMAKIVWRTGSYVGVSILRTVDMRTASGPEAASLHKLWREHIGR